MENKVLVEITVAGSGKSYDVFIPCDCLLCDVMKLLISVISDLLKGEYLGSMHSVLCDFNKGFIFNINKTVGELGINNGSHLLLL